MVSTAADFLHCTWHGQVPVAVWSIGAGMAGIHHARFGQKQSQAATKANSASCRSAISHMGFNKPERNTDVTATLRAAVEKINALPAAPDFIIHTGDLTHSSKPEEFDTLDQVMLGAEGEAGFLRPGQNTTTRSTTASSTLERYTARTRRAKAGINFDHKGVHLQWGWSTLAALRKAWASSVQKQLDWLAADLNGRSSSTPLVLFAHLPAMDGISRLGLGHAGQRTGVELREAFWLRHSAEWAYPSGGCKKVEGNVAFHTAMSTTFPQPAPGSAPAPGPMKVPAEQLRSVLGIRDVTFVPQRQSLAVVDRPLADGAGN